MADKLLYIPNDDTQNCLFCRYILMTWLKRLDTQVNEPTHQLLFDTLDFQLNELTNQSSIKVLNVIKPTKIQNFGD